VRRLAIAIMMTVPLFAGSVFAQQKAGKDSVYEELNLFDQAYERIREDAVDPVTDAKLIGAAIAGMLSGLDPRSSFMDEAQFKTSQTPANDDAATLGLAVTIENGQLKVISPQDGSPAAQSGVTPGDVIFSIDKEPTYDLTLHEAEQKLRGPAGSEVELTLRRGNAGPSPCRCGRCRLYRGFDLRDPGPDDPAAPRSLPDHRHAALHGEQRRRGFGAAGRTNRVRHRSEQHPAGRDRSRTQHDQHLSPDQPSAEQER